MVNVQHKARPSVEARDGDCGSGAASNRIVSGPANDDDDDIVVADIVVLVVAATASNSARYSSCSLLFPS